MDIPPWKKKRISSFELEVFLWYSKNGQNQTQDVGEEEGVFFRPVPPILFCHFSMDQHEIWQSQIIRGK